jgi:ribonucleoside-diphosphate reductase alpha chain
MSKLLKYFKGDELAASVWAGKYKMEGEETPDDMHRRMAKEFARIEKTYIEKEKEDYEDVSFNLEIMSDYALKRKPLTEERIFELFKDFKYIIPQGSIAATLGTNQIASLSNCWVIESPLDSYAGIHKADGDLIYYYKRRGGVGGDISNLRPEGIATNNAAKTSTGAVSFMERFSNTTREVAMNGRRGALMLSIDVNHPDVLAFAKIKEDKTKVTGANISIRLNNEFMKAVENDEDYILRFPCDMKIHSVEINELNKTCDYNILYPLTEKRGYIKRIKAKEYWDEFIRQAKNNAEPGLMYWDNVINYDPAAVYPQYIPICSNPCGEQFLQANDSCRLMLHNLFSYVVNPFTPEARFDYDLFYKHSYEATRLGDDLVDLEAEYIQRIIDKIESDPEPDHIKRQELELWEKSKRICLEGRRVGLGITALGDAIAGLGFKYDSEAAYAVIGKIMHTKMEGELDCTIDLGITRGTFEGWNAHLEYEFAFGDILLGKNDFYQMLLNEFSDQAERMCEYGRRSISWSNIAPAGSQSILAKVGNFCNATSGLEPTFYPWYMRRKKVNPGEKGVRVDFTDANGDTWMEYAVIMGGFKDWLVLQINDAFSFEEKVVMIKSMSNEQLNSWFKVSPYYGSTANDINWIERVKIQALLQKYTTNAISSTINLPSTVTEQEVSDIYMQGWKRGLKGQTVYVDGSRSGVLISSETKSEKPFEYKDAIKRPRELDAEVHLSTTKDVAYKIIVGLLDSKPYEVFVDDSESNYNGTGIVFKKSKGSYFFKQNDLVHDITSFMSDEQEAITRLVSGMLRHGSDIKYVVEQLNKVDGELFSFTKSLARVLKKYIPDGAKSTVSCEDCGSEDVIFEEGCSKCRECGSSKCG